MTHFQDIQKLRFNQNIPHYYSTTQRFSQPSQSETYNINIDKFKDNEQSKPTSYTFRFY
jgi:hypothetical protein